MDKQFEIWWGQHADYCGYPDEMMDHLKRFVKDAFDMGVACGMDEMTDRIKDSWVLGEPTKSELLADLDK